MMNDGHGYGHIASHKNTINKHCECTVSLLMK